MIAFAAGVAVGTFAGLCLVVAVDKYLVKPWPA